MTNSIWILTTLFTICIIFFTEESIRQGKEWKDKPGARSLEDRTEEYGLVRQALGDIACMFCCSLVTRLPAASLQVCFQLRGDWVEVS